MWWRGHTPWARRLRWFLVGGVFTALGLALLKLFVEGLHWPYAISTAAQSEVCNVLRFLVNDRWVFGHPRPTWKRLVQYHVANALGFLVWWIAANALESLGMHYLLASVVAILASGGVSLFTNFRWIWRRRPERSPRGPSMAQPLTSSSAEDEVRPAARRGRP